MGFVGFVFAIADNAAMNIVYLRGTLLGHVLWKSSFHKKMQLFCVAGPVYTLPALCELPFFHISPALLNSRPSHLASLVEVKWHLTVVSSKSPIIPILVLLYVRCPFSLPAFTFLSFKQFDYDVLGVGFFFHVSSAGAIYLCFYGFHKIWNIFDYYFFNYYYHYYLSSHCFPYRMLGHIKLFHNLVGVL